jgi:hypothetical protein
VQIRLNMYGMNYHLMRSIRDTYKVICDGPSPTATIPRAEAAKAATMITDEQGLQSCSQAIERARVLVYLNIS